MESGTRLGPYEILERIGAGGMGEVWLAQDSRLGRKVAIKVLPQEYAGDADRLARFEQEARAAAALNHPHIAVVHDVGSEAGEDGATTHFMVQEYLDGQSLRQLLDNDPVTLERALELATEVGEALVAAHKARIIHRDLKPENIFVTEEGHAKVLDFGLAKLLEAVGADGAPLSMSPTALGTVAGQVMGTAGYMAPEHVRGEEAIDQRADLFAFGCVLYEMVGGERAFGGETVIDALHAITRTEPRSLAEIDPDTPAELLRIVRKCLVKDAARRYQLAREMVSDLRQLQDDIAAGMAAPAARAVGDALQDEAAGSQPRAAAWKIAVPLVLASALVAAWSVGIAMRAEPPSSVSVYIETELPLSKFPSKLLAVSPNGEDLVYSTAQTADRYLYHRPMRETASRQLPVRVGQRCPGDLVAGWSHDRVHEILGTTARSSSGRRCRAAVDSGARNRRSNLWLRSVSSRWPRNFGATVPARESVRSNRRYRHRNRVVHRAVPGGHRPDLRCYGARPVRPRPGVVRVAVRRV